MGCSPDLGKLLPHPGEVPWGSSFPDLGNYPGEVASPTWGFVSPDLGKYTGEVQKVTLTHAKPVKVASPTWGLASPDLGKYPGEVASPPWGSWSVLHLGVIFGRVIFKLNLNSYYIYKRQKCL